MPIWAYVFNVYSPLSLFSPSRREVFLCACVPCLWQARQPCACASACEHTQIWMCPCRPRCAQTDPHHQSHLHLSICMPILPCNQHIHKSVETSPFFSSPELPNAGSCRLALVVTLIPRFLLQLASKRHCEFPNNWDEVLCKSPSRR